MRLTFRDIAILTVMRDYQVTHDQPIPRSELWSPNTESLVNDWLEKNGVGTLYAYQITGNRTVSDALDKMRELELLVRPKEKGRHSVTESGEMFLQSLPISWQDWPLEIEFVEGVPDFENAVYVPRWDENEQ